MSFDFHTVPVNQEHVVYDQSIAANQIVLQQKIFLHQTSDILVYK